MADKPKSGARAKVAALKKSPTFAKWSKVFLAHLAESSNVTASATRAKVCTAKAYEARRTNPEFNRAWQQALWEGYDNLEMELLRRLREGEVKPAAGARRGVRSYDNANAFRLLAAHRESAARFRAIRSNQDAEAIVLSINAKLEQMRQRRLAASQQVIDQVPDGES